MKQLLVAISLLFVFLKSTSQTYFTGLERMCWTDKKGKIECYDAPRKWYHENIIRIEKDSIFLYKTPVQIVNGKKIYSASDGAFYYYYGIIKQFDTSQIAYLISHNCDYCGTIVREDSLSGFNFPIPRFDTLRIIKGNDILTIGQTLYKPLKKTKGIYFPAKTMFYFDSNSISRRDPKEQYGLISQGIKNFLQTKQLKLDNDTLRVCIERYELFEQKLIETLVPNALQIDTTNMYFDFVTRNQLRTKSEQENKVIRYIEINRIIDYWKSARIELTYKIVVPKSIHKFNEKEYNNLFEYYKVGQKYELVGELPENNWGLLEQK